MTSNEQDMRPATLEDVPQCCATSRILEQDRKREYSDSVIELLGHIDLRSFRFWGLLMFGSYSVCNIIVLLNMLIAMMSTSYTAISERSDVEWKFARSMYLILRYTDIQ